jgi:hypothetical protein
MLLCEFDVNGLSGVWYVRVSNGHTNPLYLVGLNIGYIGSDKIFTVVEAPLEHPNRIVALFEISSL